MKNDMLTKISKNDLKDFIKDWSELADIDTDRAFNIAIETIKMIDRNKEYFPVSPLMPAKLKPLLNLETRWYQSLENGNPDYTIYDDQYILSDIWACWVRYSRAYLTSINSEKSLFGKSIISDMSDIKVVADLGNGFGYTTATLKQFFPDAKVYGTNFKNGIQWKLASKNAERYDFKMAETVDEIDESIDLIFASEYMEHIEKPVDHLVEIVTKKKPRYFIFANSFGTRSIGHFNSYICNNKIIEGKSVSRFFNTTLRSMGYENIKTKCWNNKPTYWKRNET